MIDDLEYIEPENTRLARLSWDGLSGPKSGFDRMAVLFYLGPDLFHEFDVFDLIAREFDALPAVVVMRLSLFVQRSRRFLSVGVRQDRLKVAA